MALTFFCQSCGKRFDLDESMAGRKARCKQCQYVFVIPDPRPAPTPSPTPPKPARIATVRSPGAEPRRIAPTPASRPAPPYADSPARVPPIPDPYGLDDFSPNPYVSPPADRDDEFLPPRPGKPTAGTTKKRKRSSSGEEFLWVGTLTLWGALAAGAFGAILLLAWLGKIPALVILGAIGLGLAGLFLWVLGGTICWAVPFRESIGQGLLCSFVPFYFLYYAKTRWETMKRPFTMAVSGYGLLVLPWIILHSAISAQLIPTIQPPANQADPKDQPIANRPREGMDDVEVPNVPEDAVAIRVRGADDDETRSRVGAKIAEAVRSRSESFRMFTINARGVTTYRVAVVDDPRAFADQIDWGEVRSVTGRTINVVVTPDHPGLNTDAAPVIPETGPPPDPQPNPNRPRFGGPRGPRRSPFRKPFRP